ncbi:helix-turn-helix domain-containing protein [Enterococcus faecalis]|uniref:helix-turn-helix domain-containing protein n=1 Tax=Enterococcus faecalis TaxID=1351 RepID=UPI0019FD589D|nr:helix-turn-helix domain-containing protein [Enterococcus faecalis]EGO8250783.1 helix-turn-helix domain-containing protein [Enterococcus faecalis]EJF1940709.1 helix-turn-helix domain-containing protein [Enterococcus faecalis]MDN3158835.1 helix-turn-helix domain-containing protein [Enterococcus faecalis]MDN3177478.1 helix-turn-helix domain-containing protein [Enterococcus faecalis]MDU1452283.1 helix-turn-helix domain-containing protein [Enterococcus faecalis]
MEIKNLVPLIRLAQNGNEAAMMELFLMFEPFIIKQARRYTKSVDEDCYQELAVQFVIAVYSFDLKKYTDE